jgi:hypothetical protein
MADSVLTYQWTNDWMITPITPGVLQNGEKPPQTILDHKWLLVMSGVVSGPQDPTLDPGTFSGGDFAVLKGGPQPNWLGQTTSFIPGGNLNGIGSTISLDSYQGDGPLYWAYHNYSFPTPPFPVADNGGQSGTHLGFSVDQMVSYVGLNGIYDQAQSVNAGYAVKEWRPRPYLTGGDAYSNGANTINNIFTGIDVDIGVRDNDAWILKLGFYITLLGKIVLLAD